MKKSFVIAAIAAAFITTNAQASTLTCTQPPECAQVVSSEYSTGGGEKTFQMFEIGCRTKNGGYVAYTDTFASAAGFFGMGRVGAKDKIVMVPGKKDKMECK